MLRAQRGLTAIELLITIAILAILIAIAAPSLTQFVSKWRVSNALNALTGSMRLARTEAIARSRPVVMCRVSSNASTTCQTSAQPNGFASGWIVFVNNDRVSPATFSSATDELLLRQEALPGIADMTPTGNTTFTFNSNGLGETANAINIDAIGYDRPSTTPWARKAVCIAKTGRTRYVADSADCDARTRE